MCHFKVWHNAHWQVYTSAYIYTHIHTRTCTRTHTFVYIHNSRFKSWHAEMPELCVKLTGKGNAKIQTFMNGCSIINTSTIIITNTTKYHQTLTLGTGSDDGAVLSTTVITFKTKKLMEVKRRVGGGKGKWSKCKWLVLPQHPSWQHHSSRSAEARQQRMDGSLWPITPSFHTTSLFPSNHQ